MTSAKFQKEIKSLRETYERLYKDAAHSLDMLIIAQIALSNAKCLPYREGIYQCQMSNIEHLIETEIQEHKRTLADLTATHEKMVAELAHD